MSNEYSQIRTAAKPSRETINGLAKGLAVVELFDGKRTQLTVSEAAKAIGASRAAARRCLLTLTELGYVLRHADGKCFTPLPRLVRLGAGYGRPASLAAAAQPLLDQARDELQDPVSLAVLDGTEVLIIARAATTRVVTTGVHVGGRLPIYCSATGRVLTCAMPAPEQESVLSRAVPVAITPRTTTGRAKLIRILHTASKAGVAYSDEEIELGMRSVAVPVRAADGTVRAAVSASTSSARVTLKQLADSYRPVLLSCAAQLSGAVALLEGSTARG
ncbi:MAG: IclR family transcriptional regulator domain-containing protein [Rhodanobacteraceae bacterium]